MQGKSRNQAALDALTNINLASPREGDLPSPELASVIEELMNPDYFILVRQESINYRESLETMNLIIIAYTLEVTQTRPNGLAQLRHLDGNYVSTVVTKGEAIHKIT